MLQDKTLIFIVFRRLVESPTDNDVIKRSQNVFDVLEGASEAETSFVNAKPAPQEDRVGQERLLRSRLQVRRWTPKSFGE